MLVMIDERNVRRNLPLFDLRYASKIRVAAVGNDSFGVLSSSFVYIVKSREELTAIALSGGNVSIAESVLPR